MFTSGDTHIISYKMTAHFPLLPRTFNAQKVHAATLFYCYYYLLFA